MPNNGRHCYLSYQQRHIVEHSEAALNVSKHSIKVRIVNAKNDVEKLSVRNFMFTKVL